MEAGALDWWMKIEKPFTKVLNSSKWIYAKKPVNLGGGSSQVWGWISAIGVGNLLRVFGDLNAEN